MGVGGGGFLGIEFTNFNKKRFLDLTRKLLDGFSTSINQNWSSNQARHIWSINLLSQIPSFRLNGTISFRKS